jgi:hypothetical protein
VDTNYYAKVDDRIIAALRTIVGDDKVLVDLEAVEPYTQFMERDSILAVERLLGREAPFHDAAAHLLIQLDGNVQEAVDADYEVVSVATLGRHCGSVPSIRAGISSRVQPTTLKPLGTSSRCMYLIS